MTTRLRTRAFLLCFLPFAALLAGSFWMIQRMVQSEVRDSLRSSLREGQIAFARVHADSDLQNSRYLRVAGENSALKAGVQLLHANPHSDAARRTVEDQLRELGERMGFDLLVISGPQGKPLAGVARQGGIGASRQLAPIDTTNLGAINSRLLLFQGRTFKVAYVPIDQDDENIGTLAVGEYFGFSEFTTSAVLLHNGKVIESNMQDVRFGELDDALAGCSDQSECNLRLKDSNWISLPVQSYGGGYLLRSLENVDKAAAVIQLRLHRLFLTLAAIAVMLALLCAIVASQTIVKPIAALVSHLRNAVRTGVLPEFRSQPSSIQEIRELAENYNRAAVSVREAGENLGAAYLEFIGSLASALDARDPYTSGHSLRVSQLSSATAAAMHLPAADLERVRIGALLHDIGKIGIADSVLQKAGILTDQEWELVKLHPTIGRRILEGVRGFAPFLGAVELHHENWDGSGYPRGQKGLETPIDARIIHVSDAYDAMTTNRSYRKGMTHERAVEILVENAGIQFDPEIVKIFASLPQEMLHQRMEHAKIPHVPASLAMAAVG
jgi:HD-GYP domain-containing protein (c-di-GMP phosphodiesterase class II)